MKITILTQYYPPETGAPQNRLSDLVKRLVLLGHNVQVLTALPNYPGNNIYPEYLNAANSYEIMDGVKVNRVSLYVPRKRTFLKRLLSYLSFAFNARRFATKLLDTSDILIMESPPLFISLAGVYIARKMNAKLIVNISDLWPQAVVDLGALKPGIALFLSEKLEAWTYRKASMITCQTEGIVDSIKTRFPDKKVILFPNGVDVLRYSGNLDVQAIRKEFEWKENQFVIGYTGVLGQSQALDQLLDAAILLSKQNDIRFVIFGDGTMANHLKRRIREEKITLVTIYPHQPTERMPVIQSALDAGIVPLAKGKVFEGARPSKMFEIMAAGKPILLCATGEAEEIINAPLDGPAGISVPPEHPQKLAEAIRYILDNREEAIQMGKRGKEYVFKHFDRQKIAENLEKELLKLI